MRQDDVLAYLKDSDEPQSVRQMCEAFGIAYPANRSAILNAISRLKKWGLVRVAGTDKSRGGAAAMLWEAVQ